MSIIIHKPDDDDKPDEVREITSETTERELPLNIIPAVSLIMGQMDGIMTTWQLAHALEDMSVSIAPLNRGLARMFHQMSVSLIVKFGDDMIALESLRLKEANKTSIAEDERLHVKSQIQKTMRKQGYIIHQLRGRHEPIRHGYNTKNCVYCEAENPKKKKEEEVNADSFRQKLLGIAPRGFPMGSMGS